MSISKCSLFVHKTTCLVGHTQLQNYHPPRDLKMHILTHTREELASKDSSLLDCCFLLKHYIECSIELLCCVWVDHRNIAFNFESGHWDVLCKSHCAQIPQSDTCRHIPLIGVLFVDDDVLGHEWGVPLTDYKISKSHFTVQFVCSKAWYEADYNTPLNCSTLKCQTLCSKPKPSWTATLHFQVCTARFFDPPTQKTTYW